MLSAYRLHFAHVAEQIRPPRFSFISPSIPLSQCQTAQVANTDGECFTTNREGFNYLLDVSLEDDSER